MNDALKFYYMYKFEDLCFFDYTPIDLTETSF